MTSFRTVSAGGLEVFYREAGKPGAPKLLLLGGFPASSHQFRNLMPALADRFHLVAIDYPGFGNTEMPDPAEWGYSFDHLAALLEPEAVKAIYLTGHRDPAKISPDNWNLDLHFLARSDARRCNSISSTTTARTRPSTPPGSDGCAATNQDADLLGPG